MASKSPVICGQLLGAKVGWPLVRAHVRFLGHKVLVLAIIRMLRRKECLDQAVQEDLVQEDLEAVALDRDKILAILAVLVRELMRVLALTE